MAGHMPVCRMLAIESFVPCDCLIKLMGLTKQITTPEMSTASQTRIVAIFVIQCMAV